MPPEFSLANYEIPEDIKRAVEAIDNGVEHIPYKGGARNHKEALREEWEELKRNGIVSPDGSESAGYIPTPIQRSPGGTRLYTLRDLKAYVFPKPVRELFI